MAFPRASGILLHPTSLPSPYGIGDLGPSAYQFLDFLVASQQKLWQVLPLGAPGPGNSPYVAYSAMAGDPMLISPEQLHAVGLLSAEALQTLGDLPRDRIDFEAAAAVKMPLLCLAHDQFQAQATSDDRTAFVAFCQAQADWLEDYALFMALKVEQGGLPWYEWDPKLRLREPGAIAAAQTRLAPAIALQKYLQFEFARQWTWVKTYANDNNIQIIGDIPIYVAQDSADVWAHQQNFCIDPDTGETLLMAGVPPDYFSETGQLWGNPVYQWDYLEKNQFAWWIRRFQVLLDYVDIIRIDHFRGFESFWAVAAGETTAIEGEWVVGPGLPFFQQLEKSLGQLPIVAEDLGIITPEVEALRDALDFPGMKILQFAFDSGNGNPYLPFNFVGSNWMVYTGTHDNNTTVGWFKARSPEEQERVFNYLGNGLKAPSEWGIHWDLIRLAFSSTANQAIIPLQDILGLDESARMNVPGTAENNWNWRYPSHTLGQLECDRLRYLTELYRR